jgi:ELWxxDGT repeat protein
LLPDQVLAITTVGWRVAEGTPVHASAAGIADRHRALGALMVLSVVLALSVVSPGPASVRAQEPTGPLKDINLSGASSYPHGFVDVNGVPFFLACDAHDDLFLMRPGDDGAGAVELARIARYRTTSCEEEGAITSFEPAVLGDRLFFAFEHTSLWVSDGTPEGTGSADLLTDAFGYREPTTVGDDLYFVTNDAEDQPRQLWRSDGSAAGTGLMRTIPARDLLDVNGTLFFWGRDKVHGWELWTTDGTRAGTRLVRDLRPGVGDSRLRSWAVMGSTLYFAVSRGTAGSELWRSDGTTAGTTRVLDIVLGSKDHVASLTLVGDQLFFSARDARGAELWASDGTRAGTRLVRDIDRTGGSYPHGLIAVGDRLFFSANDAAHGQRLWTSDGTRAGTLPLASVLLYWRYSEAALGDQLVFAGMVGGDDRYALWVSDGTPAGTHPLVDADVVADPESLVTSGGRVFLAGGTQANGREPWVTDGTPSGTAMLADLDTDTLGSLPAGADVQQEDANPVSFVELASRAYFTADDGTHGVELWRTNGTVAGTHQVRDIQPGSASSGPSEVVRSGDRLFFSASDGVHGTELWTSDGTSAGTRMVRDIVTGHGGSAPRKLTPVGDTLFFTTADQSLWASDGTRVGTRRIKASASVRGGEVGVMELTAVGPDVFFLWTTMLPDCNEFEDQCYQTRLWRTDGTVAGTHRVRATDLWYAQQLTAVGSRLFFVSDGNLWTSDGTTSGTKRLSSASDVGASCSRAVGPPPAANCGRVTAPPAGPGS